MPRTFDNMAQRAIYYFIATMPSFNPVESKSVTAKEQENAYLFIKGIYDTLFGSPEALGMKLRPDDCITEQHISKKEHPGLVDGMNSYIKKINIFIETVFDIATFGKADGDKITIAKNTCQIKASAPKMLSAFGVITEKDGEHFYFTFPKDTVKGLELLAAISADHARHKSATAIHTSETKPFLLFSRGVFDPESPWTAEVFREIYENKEAFDKMNDYFVKNGFTRVDNKESKISLNGDMISLDYVKFYGKPEGRIGGSYKTKNMSGVQFQYNVYLQSFATVAIHIPYHRELLESASARSDEISPTVVSFLSRHNNCGHCGYCVQMDKTKAKPLRYVAIGGKHVCPLYNFNMWNGFGEGTWLPDEVSEVMDFIDELFSDRYFRVDKLVKTQYYV